MESNINKTIVEEEVNIISKVHDLIIEKTGGEKGIRDKGGLYNSISKILNFKRINFNQPFFCWSFYFKRIG